MKKYVASVFSGTLFGRNKSAADKHSQTNRPSSVAEPMEARLLYSADIAPLTFDDLALHEQTHVQSTVAISQNQSTQIQSNATTELFVIDSRVAQSDILLADIASSQAAGRNITVIQIAENDDGIVSVSQAIEYLHEQNIQVSAIHIISHGSDGEFELGNQRINDVVLRQSAEKISAWSIALTGDADILIYGCNFASTTIGQSFAANLAALTGADISGNSQDTGDLALGGDWTLDYQTGVIDSSIAISAQTQGQWHQLLTITPLPQLNRVNDALPGQQSLGLDINYNAPYAESTGGNKIAVDKNGNYVVAWMDSGNPKIRFYSSDGTPKSSGEIAIPTVSTIDTRQIAVAMNENSETVVVWAEGSGNLSTVFAQRYSLNGNPVGSTKIIAFGEEATKPAVAISDAGQFVVTWQEQVVGSGFDIKARAYDANGLSIGGALTINQTLTAGDQVRPSISMRGSLAAIAWQDQQNSRIIFNTLQVTATSIAIGQLTYADLDFAPVTGIGAPDIAIDSSNKIVVTWQANDLVGPHTYYSVFAANASIYAPPANLVLQARVNADTAEAQSLPKVAIGSNGAFVIAQQSANQAPDASGWGVFARAFSADNTAIDSVETPLNVTNSDLRFSVSNQFSPAIAWRNDRLVSAWTSDESGTLDVFSRQAEVTLDHLFIVTTANDIEDSGDGLLSLREAIIASNATPNINGNPDKISFNIPGVASDYFIELATELPSITESVYIDGATQRDFNGASIVIADRSTSGAALRLEGDYGGGFSSSHSTINGLIIQSVYGSGIRIDSSHNTITNNSIQSSGQSGIAIFGNASISTHDNTIHQNIIYGNGGAGILIFDSPSNTVSDNLIQANISDGILIITAGSNQKSIDNVIIRNTIGENANGISITGLDTTGTIVRNNKIGIDAFENNIANLNDGIKISNGARSTQVGGTAVNAGNTIAYNLGYGVNVVPVVGLSPTSNSILRNSIYQNGGLGINVPVQEQVKAPLIVAAARTAAQTTVYSQIQGNPSTLYRLEFFTNNEGNAGTGAGRNFLGSIDVVTDSIGFSYFNHNFNTSVPIGHTITATATIYDANISAFGTTSKFSNPQTVGIRHVVEENQLESINVAAYTRLATGASLSYSISSSDDSARFSITPAGQLSLIAPADYETIFSDPGGGADNLWWAFVRVFDGVEADVVVHIFEFIDANDSPSINVGVSNAAVQGSVVTFLGQNAISISDPDNNPLAISTPLTLTVSVEIDGLPGQPGGFVSLNGFTGPSVTTSGTVAQLNNYLSNLQVFTDSAESRSLNLLISVNDNGSGFGTPKAFINDGFQLIAIEPVANVAPIISGVPNNLSYIENSGPRAIFGGIVLSNPDGPNLTSATITYGASLVTTEELITYPDVTLNGLTLNHNLATGTITISGTATTSVYQNILRNVSYENTADAPSVLSREVSVSVSDGIDQSNLIKTTATMLFVNDAPTLSLGANTNYAINFGTQLDFSSGLAQALTMSDPDFTAGTFTLTIRMPNSPGVGSLSYSSLAMSSIQGSGLSVLGDPLGDNSVTFYGERTLIKQAVALLTYKPSLGHTGNEAIEFILSDNGNLGSGGSLSSSVVVNVVTGTLANTAPTVSGVTQNRVYIENAPGIRLFDGISISDTQQTNIVSARITTSGAFNSPDDLQPKYVSRPGGIQATRTGNVLTLYGSFEIADYVSALNTLFYVNNSDSPSTGVRTFTLEVFDGTLWSAPMAVDVTVTPVDDPLELNLPSTRTIALGQTLTLQGTPQDLYLIDLDAGLTEYEMSLSANHGIISVVGHSDSQEVKVRGTIADLNNLLQQGRVAYTPIAGFSGNDNLFATVRFVDQGTGLTMPTILVIDAIDISVLPGTPPALADGSTKANFVENAGAVKLVPSIEITGGNNGNIEFATIQIINGFDAASDILQVTKVPVAIVAKWDSGTGTLSLTGTASIADYGLVLASLSFNNESENPGDAVRQVSIVVSDSLQQSNELIIDVAVEPINDKPTISAQNILYTLEDTGLIFSLTNAIRINDVDSNQLVLNITVNSGTLRWTGPPGVQPGVRLLSSSTVELTGSVNEINQWSTLFEFLPPKNFNGMSEVQWSLADSQGGTVNKNVAIDVTPVNDLPIFESSREISVDQGKSVVIVNTNSQARDIEDSPALLTYEISSLPVNGTLEVNGRTLTASSTFTQADIDSGLLRYKHNSGVSTSDVFSITVKDSAGARTAANTIAVSIALAPIVVIAPGGAGGSGSSTPSTTNTNPTVTTTTPTASVDTKSTTTGDGINSQSIGPTVASPASTGNQTKPTTRSTPTGSFNGGSNSPTESSNIVATGSRANASNEVGTGNGLGIIANKTVQPVQTNAGTFESQRTEQTSTGAFLRTRSAAENTEYAAILRSALGNQGFTEDVQKVRNEADNQLKFNQNVVASTTAVSATLSIGYVIWLVRGGALLSSLLASIPAWSLIDPLPILGSMGDNDEESDDDSLDAMIDKAKASREKAATVQTAHHPVSLA